MTTQSRALIAKIAVPAALAIVLLLGIQRTSKAGPPPNDVNVINTPSVNVVTSPSSALWTKDAALGRTPFQAQTNGLFQPGSNSAFLAIEVPTGKRLVIENVSVLAALNNDTALRYVALVTLDQAGGSEAEHYLVMNAQGSVPGIGDYFSANHALRAYAVGVVQLRAFRTDSLGFGQINVTVTGSLIDAN
jgi:hypothetical protein